MNSLPDVSRAGPAGEARAHHAIIDGAMDTDDHEQDPALEHQATLITCSQCGHPNLEFRNHCRRCGRQLVGSANLVWYADMMDWTATDGPSRGGLRRVPPKILSFMALVFIASFASPLLLGKKLGVAVGVCLVAVAVAAGAPALPNARSCRRRPP